MKKTVKCAVCGSQAKVMQSTNIKIFRCQGICRTEEIKIKDIK
jgi:hypothetical protein